MPLRGRWIAFIGSSLPPGAMNCGARISVIAGGLASTDLGRAPGTRLLLRIPAIGTGYSGRKPKIGHRPAESAVTMGRHAPQRMTAHREHGFHVMVNSDSRGT